MLDALLVLFCGCVVYAFGFAMGIICASRKRKDKSVESHEVSESVFSQGDLGHE